MILVNVLVANECEGRATGKRNEGYYQHGVVTSTPLIENYRAPSITKTFKKVERVVPTRVTAVFVTTITERVKVNTTVTLTSTSLTKLTPTLSVLSPTVTVPVIHTDIYYSRNNLDNAQAFLAGETICIVANGDVIAGDNVFEFIQTLEMQTSTVVPVIICSQSEIAG
ncbi:hypothetical protein ACF0H5_003892 [Mactra antiquata]